MTNLLGGHTDFIFDFPAVLLPQIKSGKIRALSVMDKVESKFLPGVKTLESLGYKGYANTSRIYALPAGTPQEIVDIYAAAIKKVMATEEHIKKMDDIGSELRFAGPVEAAKMWEEQEQQVQPLMELAKQESK